MSKITIQKIRLRSLHTFKQQTKHQSRSKLANTYTQAQVSQLLDVTVESITHNIRSKIGITWLQRLTDDHYVLYELVVAMDFHEPTQLQPLQKIHPRHQSVTAPMSPSSQWESEQRLGLYRIWLFHIRPQLDLSGFRKSILAAAGARFGENLFWDHRTIQLMILNGMNHADSCYKEAVEFGAAFVRSLPVFDEISRTARNCVILSSE